MAASEPCGDACSLGTCPLWSSCPADRAADAVRARRQHLAVLEQRLRAEDVEQGRRPFGTGIGEEAMVWTLDLRSDVEQQRDRAARARELRARVERATGRFVVPLWVDLRPGDDEGMEEQQQTPTATVAETTVVEAFCDACDEIAEVVLVDGLLLCEQCR